MLRGGGTVILCGRAAGPPNLAGVHDELIGSRRNLGLRDFYLGSHVLEHLGELPGRLDALAEAVRSAQLRIPIRAFALEDARSAHELIESGTSVGKVVLRVQPAAAESRASRTTMEEEQK